MVAITMRLAGSPDAMRKSFVEKRKTRVHGPVIEVVPMSLDMPAKNEPVRYVELSEKTNDKRLCLCLRPSGGRQRRLNNDGG